MISHYLEAPIGNRLECLLAPRFQISANAPTKSEPLRSGMFRPVRKYRAVGRRDKYWPIFKTYRHALGRQTPDF